MTDAKSLCRSALLALVASTVLLVASVPAARADLCKQAGPLPQSKCTKDSQCCPGLVCQAPPGPNKNNATMQCMGGCRIGGTSYAPGAANPANACQSCQPSVSTTAFTNKANGTTCNDGNACTRTDTCQAGACVGGNPVTCTASDQCHTAGTCNPSTGTCSNPAKSNGAACNDSNACTQTDTCQTGVCVGGNPVTCTALDACHTAGTCSPSTGTCSNPLVNCDDANACTEDSCNSASGCRHDLIDCDDSNPCTNDSCDTVNGCMHTAASSTTVCRSSQGDCDVAESCDGTSNACPTDGFASSTLVCRQSTGDCDVAESCTGTSAACPPDASQPDGTPCDDGGMCVTGVCETTTTTTTTTTTSTTTMTCPLVGQTDCGAPDGCVYLQSDYENCGTCGHSCGVTAQVCCDGVCTPNTCFADLSLSKMASPMSISNGSIPTSVGFTVTLHNAGPATATGIAVTDILSAAFTYDSSTPSQGIYDSGTGVWSVGALASGSNATLGIMTEATCSQHPSTNQTNTATVTAEDQTDSTPADDQAMASVFFACD